MTVVVNRTTSRAVQQLQRLVDIVSVQDVTRPRRLPGNVPVRFGPPGAAWPRSSASPASSDARVVDASPQAMVLAIMDAPATISAFLERVLRFGIEEITRSGRIAMSMTTPARGARPSPNAGARPADNSADPFQAQADGFAEEEAPAGMS
jgi:acetolactate synthase small subunit